ncbi:hypothetical protein L6164_023315 [Bauhinia variegata]|uniref:Uncharacterized protein n=1 Tax=Bauhinia variegata TaxID=167791 RepID=A0ACB9MJ71_BAUVA|nr:hypothetical protein L6164_023315 [Bauhinia variegata]
MAILLGTTSRNGEQEGKITVFVVLSCVVAAMGGLLYGYDTGITGGVTSMNSFLKEFFPEIYQKEEEHTESSNYCKYDSQLLTAFSSSLYVSGIIASFLASHITGNYGRKPSMITGGVAFLAGGILCGAAFNVYMLIVGRLFLGVGVGFANQSVPLYLSEMAPARVRGAFSIGFQFSSSIGTLAASLINFGFEKIKGSSDPLLEHIH